MIGLFLSLPLYSSILVDSSASLSLRFIHFFLFFSFTSILYLSECLIVRTFIPKKREKIQKSLRIKLPALPEPNDDHHNTYIKVLFFFFSQSQVFYICFINIYMYLYICFFSIRSYDLSFILTKTNFI